MKLWRKNFEKLQEKFRWMMFSQRTCRAFLREITVADAVTLCYHTKRVRFGHVIKVFPV